MGSSSPAAEDRGLLFLFFSFFDVIGLSWSGVRVVGVALGGPSAALLWEDFPLPLAVEKMSSISLVEGFGAFGFDFTREDSALGMV